MDHEPFLGAGDIATTNEINFLLGMKDDMERERHRGGSLLPLAVVETTNVFKLSYEGQAGIHVAEKK